MWYPSWFQWYKKPEYRDFKQYATEISAGKRPLSPDRGRATAIPSRLRLEKILQNETCSPMSLYDFYMYLKHIEFSSENLEFYVWYTNYEKNYPKGGSSINSGSDGHDDGSSHSLAESSHSEVRLNEKESRVPSHEASFSLDPELARETLQQIAEMIELDPKCSAWATKCKTAKCDLNPPPSKALKEKTSTLNLIPSIDGRRAELRAVIKTFLLPGAEKELNIPPAMREQALLSLETSSDPIHLRPVADHVYQLLRNCSHRNFVRLGISNGTFETLCVATTLGIVLTIAGFLCEFLLAFTPYMGGHSRWTAFAAWPLWWLGMSLVLSGLRGSCFFLLLFTRRQPLPWERFDDDASVIEKKLGIIKLLSRLMIFDRKFRVKDVHLRRLQHKIVIQSMVGGAVFASLGVLLFIFLPVWSQTVMNPVRD